MLQRDGSPRLDVETAHELSCDIQLPTKWNDFFDRRGRQRPEFGDQRKYVRFYYREHAVLQTQGRLAIIYTKDVTREGLSFLHSRQLFPKDNVLVLLHPGAAVRLVVVRCLRIDERCYECGGRGVTDEDEAMLARIVNQLDLEANGKIGAV